MRKILEFLLKYSSEIISAFSTLFSAFLGAWLAFKLQNKHEKQVIDEKNRTAINMAQISLMQKYNDLLVIQKNFVSPIPNDPLYWINIPALSPREKTPELDVSSLSSLIDSGDVSAISEILVSIELYNEIIKSINIRSSVHTEELQPRYEVVRKKYKNQLTSTILVDEMGERTIGTMLNSTNEILKILPESIKQFEETMELIYTIGRKKFPKGKILLVEKRNEASEKKNA